MNTRSLIFAAVESKALFCFHYLIEKGANTKARNRKGWNLIHVAVQTNDKTFVLGILNLGVNPNEADDMGVSFSYLFL